MVASLLSLAFLLLRATTEPGIIQSPVGTGVQGDSGDGGPASRATLNQPFDVAFDRSGNLYFSDTGNHKIRRVDARSGIITTIAGTGEKGFSGDGGPATAARLNEPYGIVLDRSGNLYFADRLNFRVRRVDMNSGLITTVAGTGKAATSGDGGPASAADLVEPNGVALDPSENRLFIADVAGHRVRVIDLGSGIITTFAGTGSGKHDGDNGPASSASLNGPRAVEVAADGTVLILERNGNTLRAVSPIDGTIRVLAGTGKKGYSGDGGPALQATFDGPKEMAISADGDFLIVDTENQAIRFIDHRSGIISTLAGSGRRGGAGDGRAATSAELDRPHGVAVGPDGSIWIGDTNNHRLRRVSLE